MVRIAVLASSLFASSLLACGGSAPDWSPRLAGIDSRAFVGDAELVVRYRYQPKPRYEMELFVELAAVGGDVGEVAIEVIPEDLDVVRGPLQWSASLDQGQEHRAGVHLRAGGKAAPRVTVVTRRGEGGAELARDTIRFVVDHDVLRECRATDPCGA